MPPQIVVIGQNSTTKGSVIDPTDSAIYSGTPILLDRRRGSFPVELCGTYITNLSTTNPVYISIGMRGADATLNVHTVIQPTQMLDVSIHRLGVWGFCSGSGGASVSILTYIRNDQTTDGNYTDGGEPL